MITEHDIDVYAWNMPDDEPWEGPPPFVGNPDARAQALAECSTVQEFIARGHEYNSTPEGEAAWQAARERCRAK